MHKRLFAGLMFTLSGAGAEPPAALPAPAPPALPLRARLTDELIQAAVRDTLAQEAPHATPTPSGPVLSGDRYQRFSRSFTEAQKPSCLGPDALKFKPPAVGTKNWTLNLGGLFALPFWAAAIAEGKCK